MVPGKKVVYQEERKRLAVWQVLKAQSGRNCRDACVCKKVETRC